MISTAKKPTKDTPVSPAEAIEHLHGIVKPIRETLATQPDNNPAAFALGGVTKLSRNGLTTAATDLQVANHKVGVMVQGAETADAQKAKATLVTVNADGKDTVFIPRRDTMGKVSFVNQATVGEAGRKAGILAPETLEDHIHGIVHAVPNREFTTAAQFKPPVAAATPLSLEGNADAAQRVRDTTIAAGNKGVTTMGTKVAAGALETPQQQTDRLAQIDQANKDKPDITGALKGKPVTQQPSSSDDKTGWRAGTTKLRGPGLGGFK